MILDRRPGKRQAVVALQQPSGFSGFRSRVLDCLGFVENDRIEMDFSKLRRISAQGSVSREHDIVLMDVLPAILTANSGEVENLQPRCEARGFFLPVEDERSWHDN